jgi:hypothetical protein
MAAQVNKYECGCIIDNCATRENPHHVIIFCPMHAAAGHMLAALAGWLSQRHYLGGIDDKEEFAGREALRAAAPPHDCTDPADGTINECAVCFAPAARGGGA